MKPSAHKTPGFKLMGVENHSSPKATNKNICLCSFADKRKGKEYFKIVRVWRGGWGRELFPEGTNKNVCLHNFAVIKRKGEKKYKR